MKIFYKLELLLYFCLSSLAIYCQESYIVKSNLLNMRNGPSINDKIIGKLKLGDIVSVDSINNTEWYKISYYGIVGFVSAKNLVLLEEHEQFKDWKKSGFKTGDIQDCYEIQTKYDTEIDNKLLVKVGSNADVVVKLETLQGECIRIAYIEAGDSYELANIPEDIYRVKVAYGKDLRKATHDGHCSVKFMQNPHYEKGTEQLNFFRKELPSTKEGDYLVKHWSIPSYELYLSIDYHTLGHDKTKNFISKKISEVEFNNK